MSDEYGPYVYLMSAEGQLMQVLQPPTAILPVLSGTLNFTSGTNPDTGRVANKGTSLSALSM